MPMFRFYPVVEKIHPLSWKHCICKDLYLVERLILIRCTKSDLIMLHVIQNNCICHSNASVINNLFHLMLYHNNELETTKL